MARLEQYLVETPCGEKFKVFASNSFDAGKQVLLKINFNNSLVSSKSLVHYKH
jgi:hypothetical protein